MKRRYEPRFKECLECVHFQIGNTSPKCRGCDAGEFFEEDIDELDPDTDAFLNDFKDIERDD
jgi:hypothetical protein